ncbi:MAG: hypothetical protein AAF236_05450 [Verrucomicrobiota bacterium]
MKQRDVFSLLWAIPGIIGLCLITFMVIRAATPSVPSANLVADLSNAIGGTADALIAPMPSGFDLEGNAVLLSEEVTDGNISESGEALTDLGRVVVGKMLASNAWYLMCAVFVLLGIPGIGLLIAAKTWGEMTWNGMLRVGGVAGISLCAFFIYGYGLIFSGVGLGGGFFAAGNDPVEFDLNGITEITDCLFLGACVAFVGAVWMGFSAGPIRGRALLCFIFFPVTLLLPLLLNWKWGGGWLDTSQWTNYDFGGAALLHLPLGAGALIIGVGARCFRKGHLRKESLVEEGLDDTIRPGAAIAGYALYILAVAAFPLGGTLEATPEITAPVFQAVVVAGIIGFFCFGLWSLILTQRDLSDWASLGAVAGIISITGAADSVYWPHVIGASLLAGFILPPVIWVFDKWITRDPLATAVVHGGGAIIGCSLPMFFSDLSTPLGQLMLVAVSALPVMVLFLIVLILVGFIGFFFSDRGENESEGGSWTARPHARD